MATKKQKRAEALRKHEAFMAERRESGRRALAAAKAERNREERAAWQENHDKNHSGKQFVKECPICRMEKDLAR